MCKIMKTTETQAMPRGKKKNYECRLVAHYLTTTLEALGPITSTANLNKLHLRLSSLLILSVCVCVCAWSWDLNSGRIP
jgi:hypothetical protein